MKHKLPLTLRLSRISNTCNNSLNRTHLAYWQKRSPEERISAVEILGATKVPEIIASLSDAFEMKKYKGKGTVYIIAYKPKENA